MNLPGASSIKLDTSSLTNNLTTFGPPAVAIVISLVVLLFIVWPKFTDVLSLRSSNKELAVKTQSLAEKADLLASLDKNELTLDLGSAEQLLPSDKGIFTFLRQIETSAGASGIIVNKVDVAPGSVEATSSETPPIAAAATKETSEAPKILLKISITSDYSSLLGFLTNIYNLPRVAAVKDMNLSSSTSSGSPSLLRTSMTIEAYWKPLPVKLGDLDSPVQKLTPSELERLARVSTPAVVTSPVTSIVPSVPTGRSDLFAPF